MTIRKSIAVAAILAAWFAHADLVCADWNLKWFPSGRAEHRAKPEIEAKNIRTAGDAIASGLSAMSPGSDEGLVLFFQEVRDELAALKLVSAIGCERMHLASVSAFKTKDNRLEWQQCAIASTLPVLDAGWSRWRFAREKTPPRGYAWAILDAPEGPVLCICVHLKSNYGATTPEIAALNRAKRENSAEQLIDAVKRIKPPGERPFAAIIVGGDFNVDPALPEFSLERTLAILEGAGLRSCFPEGTPGIERITHPGRGKFAGAAFDYIFAKPAAPAGTKLGPSLTLSDHRPVFARIPLGKTTRANGGASKDTARGRRGSPSPAGR